MQEEAAQAIHTAAERLARERECILQEAQDEAARCLANAQEQAMALTTTAYEQGFRQGEEAARQALTAQLSPVLGAFQQATTEIAHIRTTVLQQAEEDIITLAFQLARKIIRYEALEHREVLAATLTRALEQVVEQDQIVVRVHPMICIMRWRSKRNSGTREAISKRSQSGRIQRRARWLPRRIQSGYH
jgi:flagellar biosynthesis/type III secretory pathway protein FliH